MKNQLGYFEMMVAEDNTSATLRLSGYIGSRYSEYQLNVISAVDVAKAIDDLPATVKTLNVTINSRGGSVSEGVEIYEILNGFAGEVHTSVVGMAASMGSFLLCVGKTRLISKSAQVMIHNPSGAGFGTAKDLKAAAESLENITEQMLDVYEETTGMSRADLEKDMDATKFYSAKNAVKLGFCTGYLEKESDKTAKTDSALMALNPEQERLLMLDRWDAAAFANVISETNNLEYEDETMSFNFKLLGSLKSIFGADMALELAESKPEAKSLGDFEEAFLKHSESQAKAITDAQAQAKEFEDKFTASAADVKALQAQVADLGKAPVVVMGTADPSTPKPKEVAGEMPKGLIGEARAKWQFEHVEGLQAEFGSEEAFLAWAKDERWPEEVEATA